MPPSLSFCRHILPPLFYRFRTSKSNAQNGTTPNIIYSTYLTEIFIKIYDDEKPSSEIAVDFVFSSSFYFCISYTEVRSCCSGVVYTRVTACRIWKHTFKEWWTNIKGEKKCIAIMLGFVKARKWVDFVDKNLSQQTKNWDRFIDPTYLRTQHNFTWTAQHRIAHRACTQHVVFLSPNISVLVTWQWREVCLRTHMKITYWII